VHLARSFLRSHTSIHEPILSDSFVKGLRSTKWPGRCQAVPDPRRMNTTWFLDGAHTVESLECCMQWFVSPGVGLQSELPTCVSVPPFYHKISDLGTTANHRPVCLFSIVQVVVLEHLFWVPYMQKLPHS
jgi:hypothetical protein